VSTDPRDIIIRPVISEKSMAEMAEGKYTFIVDRKANKVEIKKAIEGIFDVKVAKVNTINMRGKMRRMGVFRGRQPDWKKAIVKLREGDSIKFFEGMV